MPDDYLIAWNAEARADLLDIVRFIAEDSPIDARRLAKKLGTSAASLSHHPQRGRRVPELADLARLAGLTHELEIRELIVRPWRLIYVIDPGQVRIVALLDSRRDMVAWLERHVTRFDKQGRRS